MVVGAHPLPQVSQCKFRAWVTGLGVGVGTLSRLRARKDGLAEGLRMLSEKGTGKLAEEGHGPVKLSCSLQGCWENEYYVHQGRELTASLPVPHVSGCAVALPSHVVTLPSMVARTVLAAILAECPWWAGLGTHCSLKHRREDMQRWCC